MKRKTSGSATASVVFFIASGLLASVLGVRQYDRTTTEPGLVTKAAVAAGQIITPDLLKTARVKNDQTGINDHRLLVGKRLKVSKRAGDTLSPNDLVVPQRSTKTLAQHVPEGRVLYSLPLSAGGNIPYTQLNGGDRLDVLVSGRVGVRTVATDVRLVGVNRPRGSNAATDTGVMSLLPQQKPSAATGGGATTLVLAVHPQHVYPLASISNKDKVSLVLHSAHDVAAGTAISVTPESTRKAVEVVAGLTRSTVYVGRY